MATHGDPLPSSGPRKEQDLPAAAATGLVRGLLRAEGALVLAQGDPGLSPFGRKPDVFRRAFLAPDLTMAGYLFGPGRGAWIYNLGHSYLAATAFWASA